MSERKVDIKITRSPDFKLIYTNGVFGSLNPMEGRITFYVDRLIPKVTEEPLGGMATDYIERELQVEVKMSPSQFLSIAQWMQNHIERMKKEGILVKEEEIRK